MVTGQLADEINGLRRALGSGEIDRIGPHVTVRPPLNVAADSVDEAVGFVRAVAGGVGPLRLEIGPVATFYPPNPVVYLAVLGTPEGLGGLRRLEAALCTGPLTPPPVRPPRPFVPHVTINQRCPVESIEPALTSLAGFRAECVFTQVAVVRFDEGGRRWLPIASLGLAGPSVVGRGGYEVVLATSRRLDPAEQAWSSAAWAEHSLVEYGPTTVDDEPFTVTARVGGVLSGVAEGEIRGATCRLGRLMVAADMRGTGVGTHLLQAVEHLGRERGCQRVRLEALAGGRAEAYYAGRGYAGVSLLPGWRGDRDFTMMERDL